ncbi:monovalent cation/H+ antiporter subunit D family protein, partial [bacterium]|nr:monovalent cation/H+ antiporter subunit D family protein [bacterium]
MEIIASQLPLFACLASLLAVIPILLFRKTPNLREAATIGAGALKLAIVLTMLPGILGGKVYEFTFFEAVKGIPLAFRVDGI